MKKLFFGTALALAATLALVGNAITKEDNRARMKADLSGYQEAPPVSTKGSGDFRAQLNDAKTGNEGKTGSSIAPAAPPVSSSFSAGTNNTAVVGRI